MRRVHERARVTGDAATAYARLADFDRYPLLAPSVITEAVEAMPVDEAGRDRVRSAWDVSFRKGVLRWIEIDVFDPTAGRIDFEQESGDIELFTGCWEVQEDADGVLVVFDATFDLGLPGLNDFLEPVAQRALEDNVREILVRLFPAAALLDGVEAST